MRHSIAWHKDYAFFEKGLIRSKTKMHLVKATSGIGNPISFVVKALAAKYLVEFYGKIIKQRKCLVSKIIKFT